MATATWMEKLAIGDLSNDELDRLDAFRVRFCDLQDWLGAKVFRSLLVVEEEKPGTQLDIVNKMEKRGIITSFEQWKKFREVRNLFSHDYPEDDEQRAEALTIAHSYLSGLIAILDRLRDYADQKISISMDEFDRLGEVAQW